jgi:hypothetical protein
MKNICITGDSWGCGEWDKINKKYSVSHKGLEEYLKQDGFNVLNLSKPSASNLGAYEKLKTVQISNFDLILFFHTDPCRDFQHTTSKINLSTYLQKAEEAMQAHLLRLNQLGSKIYLIGGHSKIEKSNTSNFQNLHVLIPSVIEFLCPNISQSYYCRNDFLDLIVEHYSSDKEFINFIHDEWTKQNLLYTSEDPRVLNYFHPNKIHANRNAHREIYKEVIKLIESV